MINILSYGQKLRRELAIRGIYQMDFAKEIGVSRSYLSRIVNDKVPVSITTERAINKALGIDLAGYIPPKNDSTTEQNILAADTTEQFTQDISSLDLPDTADKNALEHNNERHWLLRLMLEIVDLYQPGDNIFEIYGRSVYERIRKEGD